MHTGWVPYVRTRGFSCYCVAFIVIALAPLRATADELPAVADDDVIIVTPLHYTDTAPTELAVDDAARGPRSIADVLATAPGVAVRRSGDAGHSSHVTIRGTSAEQVTVLFDGAPLNTPATPAADLSLIPATAIDRIEIYPSGSSAAFGIDGIGGIINIVTKKPATQTITGQLRGGAFTTTAADAAWQRAGARTAWLVGVNHWWSRGDYPFQGSRTNLAGTTISTPGTFTRDHNHSLLESALVRGTIQISPRWSLDVLNRFAYADRQLPGVETETTQLAPANPLDAREIGLHDTAAVRLHCADETLTLGDAPRWRATLGVQNQYSRTHFSDATPALGAAIDRRTTYNVLNPYALARRTFGGTTQQHTITARYDFRDERTTDVALNATTTGAGTHARNVWALALQDRVALWNERFVVDPLVRLVSTRNYGTHPQYHAGVAGKLGAHATLRGSVGTCDRAPSFRELFYPDEGFVRGNPLLARERAWRWDAGAAWNADWGSVSATYFDQHIDNQILFVPISATTIAPINTLAARAYGVESGASVAPWIWLRVSASYTWLRSRFAGSTAQLPGRAEHQFHGGVAWQRDWTPRWRTALSTDVHWLSATPINVANTVFVAARTTVDVTARATWKPRDGREYTAGATATNLGNIATYDTRGFPLPGRAWLLNIGGTWQLGKRDAI